ncbi:MAG: hypothetical protein AAFX92_14775 [Pseudomonadota bacterium]
MSTNQTPTPIPPLRPDATGADQVLAAMAAVATANGAALSDVDRRMLAGASRYIFGQGTPFDVTALPDSTPEGLASALTGTDLAQDTARMLAIMALVDGKLDTDRIDSVFAYADALDMHDPYMKLLRMSIDGDEPAALAEMINANMISITGKPWTSGDINEWLTPYGHGHEDETMADRFEALKALPEASFGHHFWAHFKHSNYEFPGEPTALNAAFSKPHDSAHVLTGFATDPRGELLVSTFTSTMHPYYPLAGHVLPVIFSWHLNIEINKVAKDAKGALDPDVFWRAWAGGAATTVDTFDPKWDFWAHVETPLIDLRRRWSIPDEGLDFKNPS